MAKTERKTYVYTCDLCGGDRDEAELTDLYGRPEPTISSRAQYPRADICGDCRARQIGELLDYFDRSRKPSQPVITARTDPAAPPLPVRLKNPSGATRSAGDTAPDMR
ncbi:MAG TPA: hypothetical protein VME44_13710 [Streptosporangiaceae bacterium]|nr:hypothetical protein [Streptosporangiaceae bacterium]